MKKIIVRRRMNKIKYAIIRLFKITTMIFHQWFYRALFNQLDDSKETYVISIIRNGRFIYPTLYSLKQYNIEVPILFVYTIPVKLILANGCGIKISFRIKNKDKKVLISDATTQSSKWKYIKKINYNYYGIKNSEPFDVMPYYAHFDNYFKQSRFLDSDSKRDKTARFIRIAFTGNYSKNNYYDDLRLFKITNRVKLLNHIIKVNSSNITFLESVDHFDEIQVTKKETKILLSIDEIDNAHIVAHKLSIDKYFDLLSATDFFISAPGVVMPHCHNIIESMSRGVIPILEYNNYMYPNLVDGVNCISFNSLEELDSKLQSVLTMNPKRIQELRENVYKYYDEHLSTSAIKNIYTKKNNTTVYVNHEFVSLNLLTKQNQIVKGE